MYPYFLWPVSNIFMTASMYMTVAISIDRYIVVCYPFYACEREPTNQNNAKWPQRFKWFLFLSFQHKGVVRLAFVGNFSCHPLFSDQESTHFYKLEEDIKILVYFLQLRPLQHLGNFSFCNKCEGACLLTYAFLFFLLSLFHNIGNINLTFKGQFTNYVMQLGWVGGQQKRFYCKIWYGISIIKWQPKRYYGWVGGQKTVKSALCNLWTTPFVILLLLLFEYNFGRWKYIFFPSWLPNIQWNKVREGAEIKATFLTVKNCAVE